MKLFLSKHKLWVIFAFLAIFFIVYTILVKTIDVQKTGVLFPDTGSDSYVGFATINKLFHEATGEHLTLYKITDYGSYIVTVPIGTIFLIVGIVELSRRKNIMKVDPNILALGLFYVFDLIVFILFQFLAINYRPCLIDSRLEASYPSSTTLLAMTMLISAIDQINIYIKKNKTLRISLITICILLTAFFVIGRALCGVHWLSDIIGGAILTGTLICFYMAMKRSLANTSFAKEQAKASLNNN